MLAIVVNCGTAVSVPILPFQRKSIVFVLALSAPFPPLPPSACLKMTRENGRPGTESAGTIGRSTYSAASGSSQEEKTQGSQELLTLKDLAEQTKVWLYHNYKYRGDGRTRDPPMFTLPEV